MVQWRKRPMAWGSVHSIHTFSKTYCPISEPCSILSKAATIWSLLCWWSCNISANTGRPILAPVPVWDKCQYGVSMLWPSDGTGRPVLALHLCLAPSSRTGTPYWHQYQYGDIHIPVPALGDPVPALGQCQHWASANLGANVYKTAIGGNECTENVTALMR